MSETKSYPAYESHCCGAPVCIEEYQQVKYFCAECRQPCIARKKKGELGKSATDQCFCQSYYEESKVKKCTCGKCAEIERSNHG